MIKHHNRFPLIISLLITLTLTLTNCGLFDFDFDIGDYTDSGDDGSDSGSDSDSDGDSYSDDSGDSDSGDGDDDSTYASDIRRIIINGTNGILTTSDGLPMVGATVILSSLDTSNLIKEAIRDEYGRTLDLGEVTDNDGDTCADIDVSDAVYSSDCTDLTGTYILIGEAPCDTALKLTAVKKSFSLSIDVTFSCSSLTSDEESSRSNILPPLDNLAFNNDCGVSDDDSDTDDCTVICHVPPANPDNEYTICISPDVVDAHLEHDDYLGECSDDSTSTPVNTEDAYTVDPDSCDFDTANTAVVTGYYDSIQNTLAKLGYGSVTSSGILDGSEPFDFTLIDGSNSLNNSLYDNFEDFVMDIENLTPYEIIFINSGNATEMLSTNSIVRANLQEYVESGGKLYVTDWSYMFLEQTFPSFMNFWSGGNDAYTAETPINAAKAGRGGITSDATVNDDAMADWLDNVYVNTGSVKDKCSKLSDEDINATLGARNLDDTVTLGGFLSAWAIMKEVHADILTEPKIWISGPVVNYYGYKIDNAPLVVSREEGSGSIIYSSYQTATSCLTTGFWPQERILQYLVFEL